jgi:hypothetical protein
VDSIQTDVIKTFEPDIEARLSKLEKKVDSILEQNRLVLEQNDLALKAIAHLRGEVNTLLKKRGMH